MAVYFAPLAAAFAARYSVFSRVNWPRFRPNWRVGPRPFDDYDNPDDAIEAASRLDMNGDWTASIDLYCYAARRWPEHTEYIQQCMKRVAEKQALAQM
jgi:hypothetical protein